MKRFQPNPQHELQNYYEIPAGVLEDSDQLSTLVREAARSGQPWR